VYNFRCDADAWFWIQVQEFFSGFFEFTIVLSIDCIRKCIVAVCVVRNK